MANRKKLATLLLGAALMIGIGATASFAEDTKCGAGKCGGTKSEKASKCGDGKSGNAGKCGHGKSDKAAKCGGDDKAKKAPKCGAGKCGSK